MPTYSHSRLSCFENCPLHFKFRYLDRIKKEKEEGIEAFMGSRVHDTLEKLYQDLMMQKEVTLDETIKFYREIWKKNWHENIKIVRKEYNEDNYYKIGEKCLRDYYNQYHPFDQNRTLAVEQRLMFDVGNHKFTGFIDRLSETPDGVYQIRDYKTNSRLPERARMEENRQLALYHIGLKEMWNEVDEVELIWHFLQFNKEIKVQKTPEQLKELEKNIVQLIQKIEKAKQMDNFPTNESALCKWCDYQDICPDHKHIYKTEQIPLNKFMKDDGVKLVNQYRDLSEQRSDLNKEIKQLKEAIVNYAQENDLSVIRGSDRKLKVKIEDKVDIPTKTKHREKYKQLEELLKKSKHWKEVSTLNASLLRKAIEDKALKTELQNKVAELLIEKHNERIYLSKLRETK